MEKKIAIVVAIATVTLTLVVSSLAFPAETYTISVNDRRQAHINEIRLYVNSITCGRQQLGPTCTQAEICNKARPAPLTCTPAEARQNGIRIYPDSTAGREEMLVVEALREFVQSGRDQARRETEGDYCRWFKAQTQAVKDAECAKINRPAGCSRCPEADTEQ